MNFINYLLLKEEDQKQQIDAIFKQASDDIRALFNQLITKSVEMRATMEKGALPEEQANQIVRDLEKVILNLKKSNAVKMHSPGNPQPINANAPTENIIISTFLKNISEHIQTAINEADTPSIVSNMGSHGVGPSGKKAFNFRSVISNIYHQVMDRMHKLKDTVFQQMNMIGDIHKGVGEIPGRFDTVDSKMKGLTNRGSEINNRVKNLQGGVDTVGKDVGAVGKDVKELMNKKQPMPLSAKEEQSSYSSFEILSSLAQLANTQVRDGSLKLLHPASNKVLRLNAVKNNHDKLLELARIDKNFALEYGGKAYSFNLGDPQNVQAVVDNFYNKNDIETGVEIPGVSGHKLRPRKVRDSMRPEDQ